MKTIALVLILLTIAISLHSQEIIGAWKTQLQILDHMVDGISTSLNRLTDNAIDQITFEAELGIITFCTGRQQQFMWEKTENTIYLRYLTKKQDVFIANPDSLTVRYTFTENGALILQWYWIDFFARFWFILDRIED